MWILLETNGNYPNARTAVRGITSVRTEAESWAAGLRWAERWNEGQDEPAEKIERRTGRCVCSGGDGCSHDGPCEDNAVGCGISNNYCERCLANARAEAEGA